MNHRLALRKNKPTLVKADKFLAPKLRAWLGCAMDCASTYNEDLRARRCTIDSQQRLSTRGDNLRARDCTLAAATSCARDCTSLAVAVLLCLGLMLSQSAFAQAPRWVGTAWSDFSGGAKAVCDDDDIDQDNDGLIEVCYLEDLNAVRYALDGSGLQTTSGATKTTKGCKSGGCDGYELVRDLDFQSDDSYRNSTMNKETWTTGAGWPPIGTYALLNPAQQNPFSGIFDGNGHTVSNLKIEHSFFIGLFSAVTGQINSLGLLNVNIVGASHVGSLAGVLDERGAIKNCYSNGGVIRAITNLGGLVGLIFDTRVTVNNSYSASHIQVVAGGSTIGGLVGDNRGKVHNSYSTAPIASRTQDVGGLVGNLPSGLIMNSYSIGPVTGNLNVGGLIGKAVGSATVAYSYWNTQRSGQSSSAGQGAGKAEGKTTAQLIKPIAPGQTTRNIYYGWSTDDWYFGTSSDYPAIKVNGGGCRSADSTDSQTLICGSLLDGQIVSAKDRILTLGKTIELDANTISGMSGDLTYLWEKISGPEVTFTTSTRILKISAPDDEDLIGEILIFSLEVNGQPFAVPTIRINAETTGTVVIDGRNAPDELTANIDGVSDADGLVKDETSYQWFRQMVGGNAFEAAPGATSRSSTYTLSVSKAGRAAGTKYQVLVTFVDTLGVETTLTSADYEIKNQAPVIAVIAPLSVAEAMTIDVTDKVSDPNRDALRYAWRVLIGDKPSSLLAGQATATALTVPADWVVGAEAKRTTVTLQLTVSDVTTQTATSLTVVIAKTNNGSLTLAADPTRDDKTLTAPMLDLTDDPDSTATARGSILSYQWQQCTSTDCSPANSWSNVTEEVSTASFTVPSHLVRADSQFRVLIKYKDGQGYDERLTSGALAYPKAELRMRLRVFLEGALQ